MMKIFLTIAGISDVWAGSKQKNDPKPPMNAEKRRLKISPAFFGSLLG